MDIYYSKYLKYKKKYLNLKSNENHYGGKKPASKKSKARCLKDNQKITINPFHKITKEEVAAAYIACEKPPTALRKKMISVKVKDNDAIKYLLEEYVGPAGQKYTPQKLVNAGYTNIGIKRVVGVKGLKDHYTASDLIKKFNKKNDKILEIEANDLLKAGYNINDVIKAFYPKYKKSLRKAGIYLVIDDKTPNKALKKMDKNYPDSFVIPNYVKKIGKNAFSMREDKPGGPPKKVTIPGSVTKIGDRAFYNTPLEEVTISDGVEKIGKETFVNTPLEEVTIPNSVKSIGKEAFFGTALTDVTISKNTKIKDDTFPSEVTINRV